MDTGCRSDGYQEDVSFSDIYGSSSENHFILLFFFLLVQRTLYLFFFLSQSMTSSRYCPGPGNIMHSGMYICM
jgi:hypothetical protein